MKFFSSDHHFFHKNILKYEQQARPFQNVDEMHQQLITCWNQVVSPDDEVFYLGDFAMASRRQEDSVKDIVRQLNGIKYLIRGNHDYIDFTKIGFQAVYQQHQLTLSHHEIILSHETVCTPVKKQVYLPVNLCHYPYIDRDLYELDQREMFHGKQSPIHIASYFPQGVEEALKSVKNYLQQKELLFTYYDCPFIDEDNSPEVQLLRSYLQKFLRRLKGRSIPPKPQWLLHGHVHSLWQCKPLEKMLNVSVECWNLTPVSERQILQKVADERPQDLLINH